MHPLEHNHPFMSKKRICGVTSSTNFKLTGVSFSFSFSLLSFLLFCHRPSRHLATLVDSLKILTYQKLQFRAKSSPKQIKNKHSALSLYAPMLDLNNYVATNANSYVTWTETSEKCKKNIFSKPYLNTKSVAS